MENAKVAEVELTATVPFIGEDYCESASFKETENTPQPE